MSQAVFLYWSKVTLSEDYIESYGLNFYTVYGGPSDASVLDRRWHGSKKLFENFLPKFMIWQEAYLNRLILIYKYSKEVEEEIIIVANEQGNVSTNAIGYKSERLALFEDGTVVFDKSSKTTDIFMDLYSAYLLKMSTDISFRHKVISICSKQTDASINTGWERALLEFIHDIHPNLIHCL